VSVVLELDSSGMVRVQKAEAIVQVTERERAPQKPSMLGPASAP
jgi:hypothetical protein